MAKGDYGFYAVDAFGAPLDGTAGARECTVHGVIKENSLGAPHLVANEFICGRLALLIGLPVPPGVIVKLDGEKLGYASMRFGARGETPPPIFPADLTRDLPELALKIVTFDCWVANTDRHESNLAYSRALIPPMIFDHDKALLAGRGLERLDELKDTVILDGCLVEHIRDRSSLGKVLDVIRFVERNFLDAVCDEALRAGAIRDDDELDGVIKFLRERVPRLATFVNQIPSPGQLEI